MKDWVGNNKAIYTTLGASNHALDEREEWDYYATHPSAIEHLLKYETPKNILEPSAGELHLTKPLREAGIKVFTNDIIERSEPLDRVGDFFTILYWKYDILMNPPYKFAKEHIEHGLKIMEDGSKLFAFLKLQFLEGKGRKPFFEKYPPKIIYVFSFRCPCAKNGDFAKYPSSAIAYGWFVWEKGFKGDPIIKWI